jgi:hypothetical protein
LRPGAREVRLAGGAQRLLDRAARKAALDQVAGARVARDATEPDLGAALAGCRLAGRDFLVAHAFLRSLS